MYGSRRGRRFAWVRHGLCSLSDINPKHNYAASSRPSFITVTKKRPAFQHLCIVILVGSGHVDAWPTTLTGGDYDGMLRGVPSGFQAQQTF